MVALELGAEGEGGGGVLGVGVKVVVGLELELEVRGGRREWWEGTGDGGIYFK